MKNIQDIQYKPKFTSPCHCLNIRRASRAVTQFYEKVLEPSGLKVTQYSLLRNLELVEHRVLRRLNQAGMRLPRSSDRVRGYNITEELALRLGLLFRALAHMRSRDRMRSVTEGIEAMGREEAAYWLGMAMHRKNPRRVLTALR